VRRYLHLCILDLLTRRPFFLRTEKRVSFSLGASQELRIPVSKSEVLETSGNLRIPRIRLVYLQSGTSVPKYSNPICQLTLHCMVAGFQTPTYVGARCWLESCRNQAEPRTAGLVHQGQNNGTRALRKFSDARNITLQCNVIFFIDSNLPHCPKDAN
jgi:hypothetical protein